MNPNQGPSTRARRRSQRAVAAALIALLLGSGCASYVPEQQLGVYAPHSETIALWARNPIVCAPTALGNAVGALVGGPIAFLVWPAAKLTAWSKGDDDLAYRIYGSAFLTPVLLVGAAVGSVFLPLSYAAGKDLCYLGVSAGWKDSDGSD